MQTQATYSDRSEPFGPLVLATAQKLFPIAGPFGIDVGTQTGLSLGPFVATRSYVQAAFEFSENTRCSAGGYVANRVLVGGNRTIAIAPWAGCDIELVEGVFAVEGDWDFGAHASGGATVGPKLHLTPHSSLVAGVRAPNPWADDALWAGVVQFEVDELIGQ